MTVKRNKAMSRASTGLVALTCLFPVYAAGQTQAPSPAQDGSAAGKSQRDATQVEGVVINGGLRDVSDRIDRRIYNVKDDPQSQTGTARNILGKIPSVQVAPNGGVTLRGDPNVSLMIDGKYPSNGRAALETLPAASIDRVEVMTNPSAQYAPDGVAGIINIITKRRHPLGLSGNLNASVNTLKQVTLSPVATLTKGPWTLDGRLYLNDMPYDGGSETVRSRPVLVRERDDYDGRSRSAVGSASLAYKLSEQSVFTVTAKDYYSKSKNHDRGTYRSAGLNYDRLQPGGQTIEQSDFGATYEYQNEATGDHLTLDGTHTTSDLHVHGDETDTYLDGGVSTWGLRGMTKGTEDVVSLDYERSLSDLRELTAGVSWDDHSSDDTQSYTSSGVVPGPAPNGYRNAYGIDQSISSAYVTYQAPIGAWTLLPGLRVEHEEREVRSATTRADIAQSRLLPSLHLEHKFDDRSKIKLSYSLRLQRPDFASYNPGVSNINVTSQQTGNPYLRPTKTNSYEIEYNYSKGKKNYEAALFYRQNIDTVSAVTTSDADGFLTIAPQNTGRSHAAGLEITLRAPISKHWKYSVNTNLSDVQLERIGQGTRDYFTYTGNGLIEYDSNKGDQLQANLTVAGRTYNTQGYTAATYRIDLSYQHPLGDRLAVVVSVTDLTNSQSSTTFIDAPDLKSRVYTRPNDRTLSVALAWKLGKKAK